MQSLRVLIEALSSALGQGAPCSEAPPQLWRHATCKNDHRRQCKKLSEKVLVISSCDRRHSGCHRWDCGDFGGQAEVSVAKSC